jgi:hypothetical protein
MWLIGLLSSIILLGGAGAVRVAYSTVSEHDQRLNRIEKYIDVYERVLRIKTPEPWPPPTPTGPPVT